MHVAEEPLIIRLVAVAESPRAGFGAFVQRSLISDQTSFGQAFEIVVHERQLHIVKIALIPCNKRVEIVWSRRDRRRNGLDAFGAKDLLVVRW